MINAKQLIFITKILTFVMISLSLLGLTQKTYGQYGPPVTYNHDKYQELVFKTPSHSIKPLKVEGMFGESIDPYSGTLSLYQVDVDIPGNSDLPVRFARVMSNYSQGRSTFNNPFIKYWTLDIPHLQFRDTRGGTGKSTRCSDPFFGHASIGLSLFKGKSGAVGLLRPRDVPAQTEIFSAQSPVYVSKDFWVFHCDINLKNHTGEGYRAMAPNGDVYFFDHMITRPGELAQIPYSTNRIPTDNIMIYPTRIEDKHGNWVKYVYSGDKLTRIHSNDGRDINISYGTNDQVSTVSANGKTWQYNYVGHLREVILPDNRKWILKRYGNAWNSINNLDECSKHKNNLDHGTVELTHPSGAIGEFTIEPIRIVTTGVPLNGGDQRERGCRGPGLVPSWSYTRAVTKKIVNDLSNTHTWTYEYDQDENAFELRQYPGGVWDYYRKSAVPDQIRRRIIKPDGTKIARIHHRRWEPEYGRVKVEGVYSSATSQTALQAISYEYQMFVISGNAMTTIPVSFMQGAIDATKSIKITQASDTYTTEHTYDWTNAGFSYGSPVQTKVSSSVSGSTTPRIIDFTYEHKKGPWLLNLLKEEKINNRITRQFDHDILAQKTAEHLYGALFANYDYYADGTLKSIENALGHKATYSNWKRGNAQSITRPDGVVVSKVVDDNGWVTSHTDGRGYTTSFAYDSMGRLTLINPAGNFTDTVIDYDFSGGGALQTVTKGNSETHTTYDGLYRPTLERTKDLSTGWASYTKKTYDIFGRTTFASFPSSSSNPTTGTNFTYDALGRILTTVENVAPYATTSTSYHSSNRKRVTDAAGKYTDYYSYGYGGPGNNNYRAIYNPAENRYTSITQNVWGQMTELRQWGTKSGVTMDKRHYYSYDDQQRLCRYYIPEAGATKYEYDDAGRMTAYAKGQGNSGCTVPNNNSKVSMSYDTMGRLTVTNFTDPNTPDYYRSYDADSNLLSVNRNNGANWSYAYDSLSNLTTETLNIDGRTYGLSYTYNNDGDLTRRTLPSGRQINYTLDGLGRATEVKNWGANLVSGVNYHASGQVLSMNYGNGHVFSQTFTPRLQPLRMRSHKSGSTALDLTYAYDARGLITSISDLADSGNSRALGYDGLGQLTSASGSWGSGNLTYDSLGNIRSKYLGSRTVNLSYSSVTNLLTQSADSGSTGTRAVSYDARGNVTTLGGLNFTYDYTDQPVAVSGTANGVGAANGSYTYDGNLKRVKGVVNNKTIYNVYDASGTLVYIDNLDTTEATDYIPGPNGVLARIDNNVVTYLHNDHLGSAVSASTTTGTIKWRERYTPFGITLNDPTDNKDKAGYTGHIKDSATGLNYMQARYYDPVIGRFLSIDPIGFEATGNPGMFNRYAYVYNNPVNMMDPHGLIGRGDNFSDLEWKQVQADSEQASQELSESSDKITDLRNAIRSGADLTQAQQGVKLAFENRFGEGTATSRNLRVVSKALSKASKVLSADSPTVINGVTQDDALAAGLSSNTLAYISKSGIFKRDINLVSSKFFNREDTVSLIGHEAIHIGARSYHIRTEGRIGTTGPAYRNAARRRYMINKKSSYFKDAGVLDCYVGGGC